MILSYYDATILQNSVEALVVGGFVKFVIRKGIRSKHASKIRNKGQLHT